jgi:hypothetical protein
VLSATHDSELVAELLEAEHFTDAIRSEVARRTRHPKCRRIAITSIRGTEALLALAHSAGDAETRLAAAERLSARRLHHPAGDPRDQAAPERDPVAERISLYVPRILQQHLADSPGTRNRMREGSATFVDITGFTLLSNSSRRRAGKARRRSRT